MSNAVAPSVSSYKQKIAVFFGGRSPEHDVSVITGLQVLDALDPSRFEAFPVYIAPDGAWYVGDALRDRGNFLFDEAGYAALTRVTLDMSATGRGSLVPLKSPFFGAAKAIGFDVAIPAFHGLYGEDGNVQGAFEIANIPYIGMRTMASALLMDKGAAKRMFQALDIPTLPFVTLRRPSVGYLIPEAELEALLAPIGFPCVIKPSHLGSSIGVAKVDTVAEAKACLPAIFEYDDAAIAEKYVENLVEYNVAVGAFRGTTEISAIERPKTTDELLDFKQKYKSGEGSKLGGDKLGGTKGAGSPVSEGMLSLTREINPDMPVDIATTMRETAIRLFDALDGRGAPRIDFIGNSKTGEIWMNEVNPLPGSFGYFLWEAAADQILFTDFLSALVDEAKATHTARFLPADPVPEAARLLKRKG